MSDTPITDPFRAVSMKSKSPLDDLYWQYAALLESHEKLELAAKMHSPEYVPEGCKIVCEKCGSDMEQSCGWPTNCNVPSRGISPGGK